MRPLRLRPELGALKGWETDLARHLWAGGVCLALVALSGAMAVSCGGAEGVSGRAAPEVGRPAELWGVDANYVRAFEEAGGTWRVDGREVDPIQVFAQRGARAFRLRIWVENEPGNPEPGTLERHALEMGRRAQAAGLYVVPTLFMSRGWGADEAQEAPLDWAGLSLEARAAAAQAWAAAAVTALRRAGIRTRTYGIGNETDYGFCGVYERTDDLALLRTRIWPAAARLMKATIAGVRQADGNPDLEFMLHISRGYDPEMALAFFETMRDEGVAFSLAGLSYYPSAWGQERTDRFDATVERIAAQLGLGVVIAEYAFPADPRREGWNMPIAGYAFDEAGQAAFVRDLKARVATDPRLEGAFYWTPEEVLRAADWSVMSLFLPDPLRQSPRARLALDEL